jgi:hypothetical protein
MKNKLLAVFALLIFTVLGGNNVYATIISGTMQPPGGTWNDFHVTWTVPDPAAGGNASSIWSSSNQDGYSDGGTSTGQNLFVYYASWNWTGDQAANEGVSWWVQTSDNQPVTIQRMYYTYNGKQVDGEAKRVPEPNSIFLLMLSFVIFLGLKKKLKLHAKTPQIRTTRYAY